LVSLVGYTLGYNTLDNNRNPTKGLLVEFKQDLAGAGGDVNFLRSTVDARAYYNVWSDLVALFRVQGGHVTAWGGQQLRMLDNFFMGPNLVRGFQQAGIGPRDANSATLDALGGTLYWGTTFELQYPLFFAPKDFGMKVALFADAGSLWDYRGILSFGGQTIVPVSNDMIVRSSVGAGLIWDSPFGPIRFDYAVATSKAMITDPVSGVTASPDRIQQFRFSGGTKF
jgi:outer membrane protein insertion porin family